jgi:hypothetical protein
MPMRLAALPPVTDPLELARSFALPEALPAGLKIAFLSRAVKLK